MRRFAYVLDPLALAAMALYGVNRWLVRPHAGPGFLHDHFNDVLLIPAALPLVLGVQRLLGWRTHDDPPTRTEIALHLGIWTIMAEILGPALLPGPTADWRDPIAYLAGAGLAALWWHRRSREAPAAGGA